MSRVGGVAAEDILKLLLHVERAFFYCEGSFTNHFGEAWMWMAGSGDIFG